MHEDLVRGWYAKRVEDEWQRHDRHRMEFAISRRLLSQHLPPAGKVLDCGGGPGRYALWLAGQGYDVSLFDLSPLLIEKARAQAGTAGLRLEFEVGTATDLSRFADASFDAVLLMGPLYHLKDLAHRKQALGEAVRVLRPGGVAATAFITRTAPLRFVARAWPERVTELYQAMLNLLERGYDDSFPTPSGEIFPAYFAHPDEVEPLLRQAGLEPLATYAVEGFVSMIDDGVNALEGEQWEAWVDLNLQLATDPTLFSGAEHLLAFGRKRSPS